MSSILGKRGENRINPVLKHLSHGRRRSILDILRNLEAPVGEDELARRLVAAEQAERAESPSEDAVRTIRVELAHVHLPALDDAGLVERDEAAGTVAEADHPLLDEPAVERIFELEDDRLDETLDCLADERRRTVMSVLRTHDGLMPRRALAHEIVAKECDAELSAEAVETALRALHHVHLPKLESAGLVAYDADANTVEEGERAELSSTVLEAVPPESSIDGSSWLARSFG